MCEDLCVYVCVREGVCVCEKESECVPVRLYMYE